jgi:predicted transcriptional regulator
MNPLEKYLRETGESPTAFSKRANIPQPTIWRIINNKVIPQPPTAYKIQMASGGAVKWEDLVMPKNRKRKAK